MGGCRKVNNERKVLDLHRCSGQRNNPSGVDGSIDSSVDIKSSDSEAGVVGAWDEANLLLIEGDLVNKDAVDLNGVAEALVCKTNVESLLL